MLIIVVAFLMSLGSLLSGFLIIGDGQHWQFTKLDILRGRRNALLYLWVMGSTIFSILHVMTIFGYMCHPLWGTGVAIRWWFFLHGSFSALLILAHAYVYRALHLRPSRADEYLWGPNALRA